MHLKAILLTSCFYDSFINSMREGRREGIPFHTYARQCWCWNYRIIAYIVYSISSQAVILEAYSFVQTIRQHNCLKPLKAIFTKSTGYYLGWLAFQLKVVLIFPMQFFPFPTKWLSVFIQCLQDKAGSCITFCADMQD